MSGTLHWPRMVMQPLPLASSTADEPGRPLQGPCTGFTRNYSFEVRSNWVCRQLRCAVLLYYDSQRPGDGEYVSKLIPALLLQARMCQGRTARSGFMGQQAVACQQIASPRPRTGPWLWRQVQVG